MKNIFSIAFCIATFTMSAQSFQVLDVNHFQAGFNAAGDQLSTPPNFTNPVVTPHHDISYSVGNLWIGGYDANGQLHTAAQTYRQTGTDFWAGAMDTLTVSSSNAQNTTYNNVWKINKTTIDSFRAGQCTGIPLSISSWPGNGNSSSGEARQLAPYIDVDGDGNYNPAAGDYPNIRGDQALFFVYNDSLSGQIHGETGGRRLGVEIRCLAYAVACTDDSALSNTVFMHYEIINRSSNTYDSTVVGLWNDFDIGNFADGIGSDSAQNDYYYYDNYFAVGAAFLNHPMANTMTYNNDFSVTGNPTMPSEYYGYMRNRWKDGAHLTFGGNGYGGADSTDFVYTGNPYSGSGWTSGTPADRRMLGSTTPFTFAPNQHYIIDMAYVAAYDPTLTQNNCASMVRQRLQDVKTYYILDITPCSDNISAVEPQQISNTNSVNAFPNPASTQITIQTSSSKSQPYFIFDLTGKILLNGMTNGNETTIDVAQLPAGMYFIRIGKDEMQTLKFVKAE